jgi:energy-coupling factor transporter ATP-binding protein EcfA2
MRLKTLRYVEFANQPREWRLDSFVFGPINLLVGKNASGKTRVLSIIKHLSILLSGGQPIQLLSGTWEVCFEHEESRFEYRLEIEKMRIVAESLSVDGQLMLDRGPGGFGKIFARQLGIMLDFQTPESFPAAVARRDQVQHEFFEPLHAWARAVKYFEFGSRMGKDHLVVIQPDEEFSAEPNDPSRLILVFLDGIRRFGAAFHDAIVADMGRVGYPLEQVSAKPPLSIVLAGPMASEAVGLCVQERGLKAMTDQNEMSQGMFRALAIIIQLNFLRLALKPSCILIDDIGEGLDFERSCALIELLIERARESAVQLVMSTNDRFVMNKVPLETWSILRRGDGNTEVFNYANSKEKFDEFKFTGLTNFDFFSMDFLRERTPPDA